MPPSQLLGLTRTRLAPRLIRAQQVRFTETMVSTKTSGKQKADWGSQWKKVGNTAMMYGPLVAVLMFWPYTVKPVMDRVRW
ncbi:hypothetical protein GLAREA_12096 [Glarea lozoyensis ATCC 20868]|uniref:Uncharacterized protein n=1 Tax=Glarea lozoyensis (strain ATCC 20868 / MF5171) TaxID=1116229 RepID=S3D4H1_GLAL2|nr:uncharacterized protein GLAREA_12096 [Glarea lozoyensis ATCC 20868]EPE32014.1 hypothetical protein GLAREA_12096 [Glarea lozoyensis ATCC 20868]